MRLCVQVGLLKCVYLGISVGVFVISSLSGPDLGSDLSGPSALLLKNGLRLNIFCRG